MLLFVGGICIGAGVVSIGWAIWTGLLCLKFDRWMSEKRQESLVNRLGGCVRTEKVRDGHVAL